ncbi:hypothetical protein DM02DRAFT_665790 [Periconia macrospinosa]|uniref:Uncharacterized protein n=1 Tax=Periconia macrospinosa TaxID=97972 RepID=A0A2V1EGK1_9PLEO|nr:hypothetical protein DM02DRAFT_665790 [Periconia macrospinosa]
MSIFYRASRCTASALPSNSCTHIIIANQVHRSRHFASSTTNSAHSNDTKPETPAKTSNERSPYKKTQAELDRELQLKMQGLAGDGGDAGVEYEDGQPVAMKRSVKNNMFRYI